MLPLSQLGVVFVPLLQVVGEEIRRGEEDGEEMGEEVAEEEGGNVE